MLGILDLRSVGYYKIKQGGNQEAFSLSDEDLDYVIICITHNFYNSGQASVSASQSDTKTIAK